MDSTAIQAIQQNTAALSMLTGALMVFMGALITVICGYLITRYTLRG